MDDKNNEVINIQAVNFRTNSCKAVIALCRNKIVFDYHKFLDNILKNFCPGSEYFYLTFQLMVEMIPLEDPSQMEQFIQFILEKLDQELEQGVRFNQKYTKYVQTLALLLKTAFDQGFALFELMVKIIFQLTKNLQKVTRNLL